MKPVIIGREKTAKKFLGIMREIGGDRPINIKWGGVLVDRYLRG